MISNSRSFVYFLKKITDRAKPIKSEMLAGGEMDEMEFDEAAYNMNDLTYEYK